MVCQVSKTGEITFRAPLAIAPCMVFFEKPIEFWWGKLVGCFSWIVFKIQVLFVVSGIRASRVFFGFCIVCWAIFDDSVS